MLLESDTGHLFVFSSLRISVSYVTAEVLGHYYLMSGLLVDSQVYSERWARKKSSWQIIIVWLVVLRRRQVRILRSVPRRRCGSILLSKRYENQLRYFKVGRSTKN